MKFPIRTVLISALFLSSTSHAVDTRYEAEIKMAITSMATYAEALKNNVDLVNSPGPVAEIYYQFQGQYPGFRYFESGSLVPKVCDPGAYPFVDGREPRKPFKQTTGRCTEVDARFREMATRLNGQERNSVIEDFKKVLTIETLAEFYSKIYSVNIDMNKKDNTRSLRFYIDRYRVPLQNGDKETKFTAIFDTLGTLGENGKKIRRYECFISIYILHSAGGSKVKVGNGDLPAHCSEQ